MPIYSFHCPACGRQYDRVRPMAESGETDLCDCGAQARRDWRSEVAGGVLDSQNRDYTFDGDNGTRLYPSSYLPHQAAQARREHPGTDFRLHNGALIPEIHNRRHKLAYLKEMGHVELN